MLDLSLYFEARALIQYAEVDGDDPEPTAALWVEATMAEARSVVAEVIRIRPDLEGSEWYEDFLSAHRYIRRHGLAAAQRLVR
jgi:hypothetical protein